MLLVICSIFFSFKNLTKILDKTVDVEPNYTDDSTCIQEAENETCAARWTVTSIGMLEWYNAYIKPKHSNCMIFCCVCMHMQQFKWYTSVFTPIITKMSATLIQ